MPSGPFPIKKDVYLHSLHTVRERSIQNSMKKILILFCLLPIVVSCSMMPKPNLKLWYDEPAAQWVEALPLGNGRLGAMVYGQPVHEEIQLNEETIWGGSPHNNVNPLAADHLDEIRDLLFAGKNQEAQALCGQYVSAQHAHGMPYQTIGSLHLDFTGLDSITDYTRELNISKAVATTTFQSGGVTYTREAFTSFTDDVLVIRLTADKRHRLSFTASYTSPMEGTTASADGESATLTFKGHGYDHEGVPSSIRFTTIAQFMPRGGTLTTAGGQLTIADADEVTIFVSTGTNFVDWRTVDGDDEAAAYRHLAGITPDEAGKPLSKTAYGRMLTTHSRAYSKYFDRVQLFIGINRQALKTTDTRIAEFREGDDPQLVELYFQFGRYLLISCSQPGGQAANLQGIWNDSPKAPWDGKYTSNINLEMNYWPAEITNLPELYEPLLRLTREVAESGRESAAMYGCRGWTLHHNTDIWRSTGAVDGPAYGIWPTCNAWLCQHLYDHYLFSGDRSFLTEAWPIMKGACEFFVDFLVPEPTHGWLVVAPSFSPENQPHYNGAPHASVVAGTTMDTQLVHDLFANSIAAAGTLGVDALFADTLRALLPQLVPMQVGSWGQLQEWMDDWDDPNDHHRHVSHLWGLYPGNQITSEGTPDLFQAARTSLVARGDASTGWSMGWKVCLWARLLDGDHAMALIREQIKPAITERGQTGGTYPNLFDAHPPFQIDGNFGCCAGIAEMLVQSHEGFIRLLPALPSVWSHGRVSGLRCRGGFEITDLRWNDGQVDRCTVKSTLGGMLRIHVNGTLLEIQTRPGQSVIVR